LSIGICVPAPRNRGEVPTGTAAPTRPRIGAGKRKGSGSKRRAKQKASQFARVEIGRPRAFPDSFRRRVGSRQLLGRFPDFRVVAGSSAFPSRWLRIVAGFISREKTGSPITVAGPRPICTAFPFTPPGRTPQELGFQRTLMQSQTTTRNLVCQTPKKSALPEPISHLSGA